MTASVNRTPPGTVKSSMRRLALLVVLVLPAAADTSPPRSWKFTDRFDRLSAEWEKTAGEWTVENGALVGRGAGARDQCAVLTLKRPLLGATVLEIDATAIELGTASGLQIQFAGQKFYHYGGVSGIWPPYATVQAGLAADTPVRIRLRRTKDGYEFAVNDKVIVAKEGGPGEGVPPDEIVLWATYGAMIRYDNLRVR
jgi:hypothetical protein